MIYAPLLWKLRRLRRNRRKNRKVIGERLNCIETNYSIAMVDAWNSRKHFLVISTLSLTEELVLVYTRTEKSVQACSGRILLCNTSQSSVFLSFIFISESGKNLKSARPFSTIVHVHGFSKCSRPDPGSRGVHWQVWFYNEQDEESARSHGGHFGRGCREHYRCL